MGIEIPADKQDLIREVYPHIYCIKVPLPHNPLRQVNSYLIYSGERPLLVDVGFDLPECHDAIVNALEVVGLTLEDIDLFFTHAHADHCGCAQRLYCPTTHMYAGFLTFEEIQQSLYRGFVGCMRWLLQKDEYLQCHCFTEGEYTYTDDEVIGKLFDMDINVPEMGIKLDVVHDGSVIDVGEYHFTCVHVQGHCYYHMCLYEPEHKLLLCGDQLLPQITPVISSFTLGESVLDDYIASLDTLAKLDVKLALPGHRKPFTNVPARCVELREHHEERAKEILEAIKEGNTRLCDIVQGVTWNSPLPDWKEWPFTQKFFSLGETLAHLTYLLDHGLVEVHNTDGYVTFTTV